MVALSKIEMKGASELRDKPRKEGTQRRKKPTIDDIDTSAEYTKTPPGQTKFPNRSLEIEKSLANEVEVCIISIFVTTLYLF